jgi:nitrite reductase/ring-hydroxylating ferredoxin subunit
MQEYFLCRETEMKDGDVRIVTVGRADIGVYRYEGGFYAYRNQCVHQGGPACEGITRFKVVDVYGEDRTFQGQVYDETDPHIVCPWHSYEYHLKSGVCATDPDLRLRRYEVFTREGEVYVLM